MQVFVMINSPPPAQSAPDPCDLHNEENMDARPDQEEMGHWQAINKFLHLLERQEKKGFKDLAALLSHSKTRTAGLLAPALMPVSVAEAMEAGSLPALDEDEACISPRWSCACTNTFRTTGYGYPGLSQFIW